VKACALFPAFLVALAVAGCGSNDGSDTPGRSAAPTDAAKPSTPLRVPAITAGRIGEATTATDGGPLLEIDPGGRIDPRIVAEGKQRREGVGAGATCQNVDVMPAGDNVAVVEAATLCLLNGERADKGLGPVVTNGKLAAAALRHSKDMVAKSYFSHDAPDGTDVVVRVRSTGYFDGADGWSVGENLAWGTGSLATPRSIMQAWMNSDGHRANILRSSFREIGFGVVIGNPQKSDGAGATYTTAFGALDGVQPVADSGSNPAAGTDLTTPATGTAGTPPGSSQRTAGAGAESTKRSAARAKRSCRARRSIRRIRSTKARKAAVRRCRARAARRAQK
jgi:uncharacterized protein YkwD